MTIATGSNALASDFITEAERNATPSNDSGRVPQLESDGRLSPKFLNFGLVSGTSTPQAITTDGFEKVIVMAKGTLNYPTGNNVQITITLKYNGVVKDTQYVQAETDNQQLYVPFSLMYTETPTSGTRNITVETDAGTINNLVIIAIKC